MAINDVTAATSTTSGALTVAGGTGFQGSIFATEFVSVSDATLKTNINPLNDPLQKIKQLE
eukprot:Pgem_evm2s19920